VRPEHVQRRTGLLQRQLWHLHGARCYVHPSRVHGRTKDAQQRALRQRNLQ
jgi:hypothetical protein